MNRFELTVLVPISEIRVPEIQAELRRRPIPAGAETRATVFTVEVDRDLEWMKKNADEFARVLGFGSRYNGLYIRPV